MCERSLCFFLGLLVFQTQISFAAEHGQWKHPCRSSIRETVLLPSNHRRKICLPSFPCLVTRQIHWVRGWLVGCAYHPRQKWIHPCGSFIRTNKCRSCMRATCGRELLNIGGLSAVLTCDRLPCNTTCNNYKRNCLGIFIHVKCTCDRHVDCLRDE